jgi:hypothetical protein
MPTAAVMLLKRQGGNFLHAAIAVSCWHLLLHLLSVLKVVVLVLVLVIVEALGGFGKVDGLAAGASAAADDVAFVNLLEVVLFALVVFLCCVSVW